MTLLKHIRSGQSGSAAVEFAFAAPIILLFMVGIIQLGIMFAAVAGMGSAVNEGARYATVYPTPTDSQIVARMNEKRFMVKTDHMTIPQPVRGQANGVSFVEVSMIYSAPINFVFFATPNITLRQTRRAYLS